MIRLRGYHSSRTNSAKLTASKRSYTSFVSSGAKVTLSPNSAAIGIEHYKALYQAPLPEKSPVLLSPEEVLKHTAEALKNVSISREKKLDLIRGIKKNRHFTLDDILYLFDNLKEYFKREPAAYTEFVNVAMSASKNAQMRQKALEHVLSVFSELEMHPAQLAEFSQLKQNGLKNMSLGLEFGSSECDLEPLVKVLGDSVHDRTMRQYQLEQQSRDSAVERYMKSSLEVTRLGKGSCLKSGEKYLRLWFTPLMEHIKAKQEEIHKNGGQSTLPDNLLDIPAPKLAVITMHTVLGLILSKPDGLPFISAAMELGKVCNAEANVERIRQDDPKAVQYLLKQAASPSKILRKTKWAVEDGAWEEKHKVAVGAALIHSLIETCQIEISEQRMSAVYNKPDSAEKNAEFPIPDAGTNIIKAFYTKNVKGAGLYSNKVTGTLFAHPELLEQVYGAMTSIRELVPPRLMPMLIPPRPWVSPNDGAYLIEKSTIMRTRGSTAQEHLLAQSHFESKLQEVYDCLNVLGTTPWMINQDVQKIVEQVWQKGGGVAELPSRINVQLPPPPVNAQSGSNRIYSKFVQRVARHNNNLHSLRCDAQYKMAVARDFKEDHPFYFPHNMDFRGRVYPIPPHLNHLGSDLCRGLLLFHEGRKLGSNGLNWMKIHLANLYGKDKIPFTDRIKFAEDNMDKVFDCADHPLDGTTWWLHAEEPWQCLATCFELAKAVRSGDPENYVSHLPIHQDGTCNGLQHYAALGGDVHGARAVNLLPSERPQDVYTDVAKLVQKRIEQEARDGNKLAQKLATKIERKIVKQTVMTSVYGVTFIGARMQIVNAMKDRETLTDDEIWAGAHYVTVHTFAALREMFLGAREIMDWLANCAQLIARDGKKQVQWVTPLGLPVIQPYKVENGSRYFVKTMVQTVCLQAEKNLPVNSNKQKSAFPPNYIHSLDSTHMLYTAAEMHKRGHTFASVHDSYWTHASTVEPMNQILREKFVELHGKPLLSDLLDMFKRQYPNVEFPPIPKKGDLNLEAVNSSQYFFN